MKPCGADSSRDQGVPVVEVACRRDLLQALVRVLHRTTVAIFHTFRAQIVLCRDRLPSQIRSTVDRKRVQVRFASSTWSLHWKRDRFCGASVVEALLF